MTHGQQLRHVSLPLAFRIGFPPWVGPVLALFRGRSLAGIIGHVEFTRSSQILITRTHQAWVMLFGMGLDHFALCCPISRLSRAHQRKKRT